MDQTPELSGRRWALDGLRGVAALLVVAAHVAAYLLPIDAPAWVRIRGASLGVDLFFVLSGFLITTLLLQEHHSSGTVQVGRFYIRRARRLLPAALTLLFTWALVRLISGAADRDLGQSILVVLTYTTDYYKNATRDVTPGLGHLWTLAVEEQFYLLWPLVLLLLLRARVPLRGLAIGSAGLALLVVAHRAALLSDGPEFDVIFRADAHCDGLLWGVAMAAAWRSGWLQLKRPTRWGWAGLAAFLTLALLSPQAAFEGPVSSLTYAAAALLASVAIFAALSTQGSYGAVLASRPCRFLGRISYSLYLWHVPVLVTSGGLAVPWPIKIAITVCLSLATAAGSYRFIERPFLHRSRNSPTLRPHSGERPVDGGLADDVRAAAV